MNLANRITLVRVFLVPIFIGVFYMKTEYSYLIATFIFIIASLTDALDGYIARSQNLVTNLGKFMDPLADKILTSAALILLTELGKIPGWVVIIIIAREFTITGFRILAAAEGTTIAASSLGKIKTSTQLIAIILLLFNSAGYSVTNLNLGNIFLYISLAFTILSGVDYIYKNINILDFKNK